MTQTHFHPKRPVDEKVVFKKKQTTTTNKKTVILHKNSVDFDAMHKSTKRLWQFCENFENTSEINP